MNKENNTVIENETLNEVNIFDEVLQSIAAHSVKELKYDKEALTTPCFKVFK